MKLQPAFLTLAMALGLLSGACTSPATTDGTGGTSGGTGGTSGGTGGTPGKNCPAGTPCGGDVVGTWTVQSSCLAISGTLDISLAGLDPNTCKDVKINGSVDVTGSWSAKADGTYVDNTSTKGSAKVELGSGCLRLSGTMITCDRVNFAGIGFPTTECTSSSSGGCSCTVSVDQQGSMGAITFEASKAGNYTAKDNNLNTDGAEDYGYCVSGGKLTVTPKSTKFVTTGTIVLQGAGSSTGGTSGTGGAAATGGKGGSAATGGSSTGGTTPTGGKGGSGTGGAATGGAQGGSTGTGGVISGDRSDGPCDIYAAANVPCVAAYSMVRALTKTYNGPLYQVRSGSSSMNTGTGGMQKDIPMLPDGYADTATQDAFCMGTVCTVSLLYDQSGKKNNLKVAPKGLSAGGTYAAMDDFESSATKGSIMINGHKVYSLYMNAREGYRLTAKGAGMPLGNTPEGIYELVDGTHYGTACCWDFGNVSTDPMKYGVMNTIFFGTGFWGKGAGSGPWFLGDFEGGVWAGGSGGSNITNNDNPSMKVPFAFGILKTSSGKYAIRAADIKATAITTAYDGASPKTWNNEGGILLGIGGDNSNNSWGTFYEGAITAGYPSNDTDLAVFKNVQAAGYGK